MHMIQLPIIILITALASNNLVLGAPASYSSSRGDITGQGLYGRVEVTPHVKTAKIRANKFSKDDQPELEQRDVDAAVRELYEREPFSLGGLWRGAKKAVGAVKKVVGTVKKVVGTIKNYIGTAKQIVGAVSKFTPVGRVAQIGKMAGFIRGELEEVSEREYHDELYDRELDSHLFEREYDEELVRDFNDATMDELD